MASVRTSDVTDLEPPACNKETWFPLETQPVLGHDQLVVMNFYGIHCRVISFCGNCICHDFLLHCLSTNIEDIGDLVA